MGAATLAALATACAACPGLRRALNDASADEFREFLLRPRLRALTSAA